MAKIGTPNIDFKYKIGDKCWAWDKYTVYGQNKIIVEDNLKRTTKRGKYCKECQILGIKKKNYMIKFENDDRIYEIAEDGLKPKISLKRMLKYK